MDPLANIAVAAARAAGNVIMRYLRQGRPLEIQAKGDKDYVTRVDHEAEAAIIATIRRAHPDHAILAEESGHSSGRSDTEWVIDPLDGTMNYIRRIPHFAVSIACRTRGILQHGVVYDPFKEELFVASRGRGANLDGRRIRVGQTQQLASALLATGFAYQRREPVTTHLAAFTTVLEACGDIRRAGSAALDLAYVAAGRLDGFWEFGLAPWDMAAGILLVQEAGGIVSDPGGRDPLTTGQVLAGTPKVHAALHQVLTSPPD